MPTKEEEKLAKIRKNLSIEFVEGLLERLNPSQDKIVKLNTLIGVKNLIKETKIEDQILYNCLIDCLNDSDEDVKKLALKIINEVLDENFLELLKVREKELSKEVKKGLKVKT